MGSGDDTRMQHAPVLATDGEFKGWQNWGDDSYEVLAGPFFFREEEDGAIRCAFRATKKHMNGNGIMHGGCVMTFADFCLFAISHPVCAAQRTKTPIMTISLNGEFIGPAFEGNLIEGSGDVVRAGNSLIFLRGIIKTGGKPIMTFSGVIKRVKLRTP